MKQDRSPQQALEGLRVVDFSWVAAGPVVTRYLGDFGATVVRIESTSIPDFTRTSTPYADGKPGVNRSGSFAMLNTSKLSITLDLKHPKGKEIAKRLVAWGDVVVENFTPSTMDDLGLGYEELRKVNPGIIMLSSSFQGQTGPYARHAGWGWNMVALGGFCHLTGWPDREPVGIPVAYTDVVAPPMGVTVIMAALDYRQRTGQGQYIDLSQYETALAFLDVPLLDFTANGVEWQRQGNADPAAAPHGVYPCQGDDRWCAIAVRTDEQWRNFARVVGLPWAEDPRLASVQGRKQCERELDGLIAAWTAQQRAEDVMVRLQAAGVPAGVAQTTEDLLDHDPQLAHRGYFWTLNHPEMGKHRYFGSPGILSQTPACPQRPPPCLGEHTEMVCTEILGMPTEEFIAYLEAGAFGAP